MDRINLRKIITISLAWLVLSSCLVSAQVDSITLKQIKGLVLKVGDVYVAKPEKWTKLYDIPEHVAFSRELTPAIRDSLLAEINLRNESVTKDSLMTSDIFYIFKPYLDWLRYIDPHYRVANYYVLSTAYGSEKEQLRQSSKLITRMPFNLLNIHDTLIVNTSLDNRFRKGDVILSINGISSSELLKYNYSDIRTGPNLLLRNYFLQNIVSSYSIELIRNNKTLNVSIDDYKKSNYILGVKLRQAESIYGHIKTFKSDNVNIGYIPINGFYPDNSRLIKVISKTLKRYKKEGITDVIFDLRGNPGGYGDRFDELLSIFIKRDSIHYTDGQKMIKDGVVSDMPEDEFHRYVRLDKTKYIEGMRYYVLIDESTGSVAATFCNILQYNNAALLVGEPLLHNALKYGETIPSKRKFPDKDLIALFNETGISTVEFNECTKAVDGIVRPDIYIPYVAKEYMTGKDAMLEKLLELIKLSK